MEQARQVLEPLREERAEMLKQATEMCDVINEMIDEAIKQKEATIKIREQDREREEREQRYRESESHRDPNREAGSGGND